MDRARQYTSGWAVAVFIPEGIVNSPMLLYSVHPGVAEKLAERQGLSARDLEQQLLAWMLKARFEGKDVAEGVICAPLFAGDLLANADTPDTTSCKALRRRLLRNAAGDPEIAAAVRAFYSTWSAKMKAGTPRASLVAATMKVRSTLQPRLASPRTPCGSCAPRTGLPSHCYTPHARCGSCAARTGPPRALSRTTYPCVPARHVCAWATALVSRFVADSVIAPPQAMRTAIQDTLRVLEGPRTRYNAERDVKPEFRASLAIFAATERSSRGAAVRYSLEGHFLHDHARSWTAVSNKQVEGGLPAFAKAMGSMQGMSHSRKARVDQHCWVASSVAWAACLTPASTGTAVTAQGGAQQLNDLCTLFSGLGMHHLLYATGKRGDAGLRASASPRGHTRTSTDDGDGGGRVEGLWEGPGSGDGLEHEKGAVSAAAGAAAVGTAALARDVDAPASDDDMFDGAGEPGEGQRGGDGGEHEEGSDAAAASTPATLLPAAVAAPLIPDDGEEADVSESEEEAVGPFAAGGSHDAELTVLAADAGVR